MIQLDNRIVGIDRSIIPACDMLELRTLEQLVRATCDIPCIGAYKIGAPLVIKYGLPLCIETVRKYSSLPVIYDQQKACDIVKIGIAFAKQVRECGANAVVLFPLAGMNSAKEWIKACRGEGLGVLVEGHLTEDQFLENEQGFMSSSGPTRLYSIAAEAGVTNFVVPGNHTYYLLNYWQTLENIFGSRSFTIFASGFISRGGNLREASLVLGGSWHAIIGSALYDAPDEDAIRATALDLARILNRLDSPNTPSRQLS